MRLFIVVTLFFAFVWGENRVPKTEDFTHKRVTPAKTKEKIAITCYGGAVQQVALFLGEDAIMAHPGAERFPFFEKIYPKLAQKPTIGTFNDVNFETLIKAKPDLVFAGVTSLKTNKRIEALGIPLFTLGIGRHTVDTLLHEFHQVGIFLGREKKADGLIAYWREKLQSVEEKLPPKAQRKKVLYVNGSHIISSEGKGWWGDDFITHAGGINIAEGLKVKGDISSELLLAFNPDVIIISNNKNFRTSPESLRLNPMYKNLTAVRNGEVYLSPVGGFWWDRPSPESILGILWLAKVLYPEEMQTIDLKAEAEDFFKDFYNYTLQEKAYQSFFARTKDIR